jgi:hypothetical protein
MRAGVPTGSMRRTLLLAAAVSALAMTPAALAKGPLQVCGGAGCAVLGPETDAGLWLGTVTSTTAPAPSPAPYYVLRFSDFGGTLAYWIPSASVLRTLAGGAPRWSATAPEQQAALLRATEGLQPHAAPTSAVAFVDYANAKHGETYLRLLTIGTPVAPPPASTEWIGIWLHGGASPWNDGMSSLWISKQGSVLKRDGRFLRISPAIAKRIRARLPLG